MRRFLWTELRWLEQRWRGRDAQLLIVYGRQELKAKAARVQWGRKGRQEAFALFSRKGFTPELRKVAGQEGVLLLERDEREQTF